jgi:hypothetical protein
MPLTTLFTKAELAGWLRQDVTDDQLTAVESVVWGWIAPILKADARPDALTPGQYAAALELGGIAFSNPEGLSSYGLDTERSVYSSERRDEILAIIAAQAGSTVPGLTAPAPVGCFPPARRYPDPAERCGRW